MASVVWTEHKHPVIIAQDGSLMRVPTLWLISLTKSCLTESYISDLAGRLTSWLSFLEEQDLEPEEVIHSDVIEFRDLQAESREPATVNFKLDATVQFYWWAKEKGFYRPTIIGWKDFYKPELQYQIELNAPKPNSRSGSRYVVPFLLRRL